MKKANSKSAKSAPAQQPKDRVSQVRTLWKSLVESAFDFFEQAVKEHATSPKYAIGGTLPEDDTGYSSVPINCSECGTDEVYMVNGRYRCLNCMEEWDEISQCEWCNEYNTGDMDKSYIEGCSMCEGMSGWKGDRD